MFDKYNLSRFLTGRSSNEESDSIRASLEDPEGELRSFFAATGNVLDPERVSALMALVDEAERLQESGVDEVAADFDVKVGGKVDGLPTPKKRILESMARSWTESTNRTVARASLGWGRIVFFASIAIACGVIGYQVVRIREAEWAEQNRIMALREAEEAAQARIRQAEQAEWAERDRIMALREAEEAAQARTRQAEQDRIMALREAEEAAQARTRQAEQDRIMALRKVNEAVRQARASIETANNTDSIKKRLLHHDGDEELGDVFGQHLVFTGKIHTLIIGTVSMQSTIDLRDLEVSEILINGNVDGKSNIVVGTAGNVRIGGKIDGRSNILVRIAGNVRIGGKIDGRSRVIIERCRDFLVSEKIDGGLDTIVFVNYTKSFQVKDTGGLATILTDKIL
jgi:hypothetical protein